MNSYNSNYPPSSTADSPQAVSLNASAVSLSSAPAPPDAPLVPAKIRKILADHEDRVAETLLILTRVVDQVGELEKDMKAQKLRINSVWDATAKLHGDDPIEWSAKEFSGLAKGWAAFHAKRYEEWKNGQKSNRKAYTEEEQQKKRAEREEKTKKQAERRELRDKLFEDFMEAKLKRENGHGDEDQEKTPAKKRARPSQSLDM